MTLSFSRINPVTGKETGFVDKIKGGFKTHTFRTGKRWGPGKHIHFWQGSPRNPSEHTFSFDIGREYCDFMGVDDKGRDTALVAAVEDFKMEIRETNQGRNFSLIIGDLKVDETLLIAIAYRDGFDNYLDFIDWFHFNMKKKGIEVIEGQVIHWTDNVYDYGNAQFYKG